VLAASVLHQYTTQFGQLVAAMKNINGIAMNLGTLSAQYNATYPNTLAANGPLSNATMTAQLTAWLNQSRSVYQGAYNTQAQVIAALATDSQNLKNLVAQSGESQGALDAIEAGNQLSGAVAAQLLKMNNQMATLNQAQMNWIAEQTQMIQDALKKSQDLAEGYTTASSATVNRSYDRLH
jgi:P-type conjugative transfer protein TrbJ